MCLFYEFNNHDSNGTAVPSKVVSPALKKLQWKDARDIGIVKLYMYTQLSVAVMLLVYSTISGYIRDE